MATLKEIADEAGVSIKTVSNILNGRNKECWASSIERARRVRDIAGRLNYQPNPIARAMRSSKTMQIGVMVRDLYNPQTGRVVELIEQSLERHNYSLLLGLLTGRRDVQSSYLTRFGSGIVDGVINCVPWLGTAELETPLGDTPFVVYNRANDVNSALAMDYEGGFLSALEYLWGLGHRRIGTILGPTDDAVVHLRRQGCERFWQSRGRDGIPDGWLLHGDWQMGSGEQLIGSLIDAKCTAILAANELMAIGAIRGANARGLRVPDDLSVFGSDGSILGLTSDPPLTTLHIPSESLTAAAVQALLARIKGESFENQGVIRPPIIERRSTRRLD